MDKNYINKIIAAFFRSGGNPETAGRFGRWLVSNVHEQEKRQAMLDLW